MVHQKLALHAYGSPWTFRASGSPPPDHWTPRNNPLNSSQPLSHQTTCTKYSYHLEPTSIIITSNTSKQVMKIATLQLRSRLGDVGGNIQRADALVNKLEATLKQRNDSVDVLVLPELAFSGYNFSSLKAIQPFLESAETGPSTTWARSTARRLGCAVGVGYPEISKSTSLPSTPTAPSAEGETRYNSLMFVDSGGNTLVNYHKHFLYYTDDPWAHEGESHQKGYFPLPVCSSSTTEVNETSTPALEHVPTTVGICMDINPYKFITPYTACEFATHALTSGAKLIILSMAWLTTLDSEGIELLKGKPDMDTFQYWISRFAPFIARKVDETGWDGKQILIVFANRAGEEEGLEGKDKAIYAGSSCVVGLRRPGAGVLGDGDEDEDDIELSIWEMLGAAEEGVCFVDTDSPPSMVGKLRRKAS